MRLREATTSITVCIFLFFGALNPGVINDSPSLVSQAGAHEPAEDEPHVESVGEAQHQPEGILPGILALDSVHAPLTKFPIGLLPAAWFLVVASYWVRPKFFLRAGALLYWLGLGSMIPATLSGFHTAGGWGHDHAEPHRNLMLISVLLALILGGLLIWYRNRERSTRRHLLAAGLTIVVLVLLIGADYGGWLVYELGHGVNNGH